MVEVEHVHNGFRKIHLNRSGELGLPSGVHPVLHHFTEADVGEDWHCHPWNARVFVVRGGYLEERLQVWADGTFQTWRQERREGEVFQLAAEHAHRIVALPWGETVTFAEYGPCIRTSMFYRRDGDRILTRPWHQAEFA